ncbi:hypothetical protein AJ79_02628 [Helicocarpus griseus UAMH5409]|uniref:Uncharacterized protein n=1 Tax=Helicocarpus griseus UAMH5409 TaxID=1447875 RepID=A0A2B7Y2L4_9EURO|nr:hypothetical protein AJ79_02628 [Helicocarpus griseus UAMH5409]
MAKTLPPTTLRAHLTRLLSRWPADPVRPASISVQTYLKSRIPATTTATPTQQQQQQPSAASVNALYSLLENRYAREYPLPANLRHPRSAPQHYDEVLREFREAPGRGLIGRFMRKIRGVLRFQ